MARLRRVDCSGPGIIRRRRGRGWEYVDSQTGEKIDDAEVLARIRELAIPPAWKNVWICAYPMGHIQAIGSDAAGRKQYIYHPKWRERRDQQKFDHMIDFARALPAMREVWSSHIALDGMPKDKVLACAARLLDRGFFRIGTEGYAEQNQTYGLATIQKHHVKLAPGNEILFDYKAKSGKRRIWSIVDEDVYEVVATLKRRRGNLPELLAYKANGKWLDVKSADINAYIKQVSGSEFTAKDFRTWAATVLAAVGLSVSGGVARSKTGRTRAISMVVKEVAHYLGNTPAVCRASYIDPRVFDRYRSGWTISGALADLGDVDYGEPAFQGAIEQAVLDLLANDRSSDAIEKIAS
ncbi:MAG: DNA topoisomerase IB [Actinomycetota bacterium]|nr:DNA topoisomerase IB [Actinomycetota bacterium]